MKKRLQSIRTIALVGALLATVVFIAANAGAGRKAPVAPTVDGFEDVNFVSLCRFSHPAPDDPIVFPALPGFSHDHTFFVHPTTNAGSTPAALAALQQTGD